MEAVCPSCGKKYKVADNSAGKRARCTNPSCGQVFVIQDTGAATIPEAIPLDGGPQPAAPPTAPPLGGAGGLDVFGPASPSPLDDLLAADVPAGPPVPPLAQAPTLRPVQRPRRDWKKPALIAGAAAGGVLLLIVLIVALMNMGGDGASTSALGKGGPLEWAGWAVPNDAKGLGYIHFEKLLASEFFKMIEKTAESALSSMPNVPAGAAQWDLFKDNVSEVFFVLTAGEKPIVVLKTRKEMDLGQMASLIAGAQSQNKDAETEDQESFEPQTHAGCEYVGVSDGFLAKTGDRTFCGTDREEDLKAALGRLEQKQAPSLNGDLRRAVDSAQGDHFFAMAGLAGAGGPLPTGGPQAAPQPEWFGIGVSVNSHLAVNGAVGFPAAEDAAKIKRELDAQMAKMQEAESQLAKLPPQFRENMQQLREGAQKMAKLVRAIRLSQDGNAIRVTAKWSRQDVQGLIAQLKGFLPMSQMRKPSFGP